MSHLTGHTHTNRNYVSDIVDLPQVKYNIESGMCHIQRHEDSVIIFKLYTNERSKNDTIFQAIDQDRKTRYILKIYRSTDTFFYLKELLITSMSQQFHGCTTYIVSPCQLNTDTGFKCALLQRRLPHSCLALIETGFFSSLLDSLDFMSKLATILANMSKYRFMHRDLHLSNVMVTSDSRPVIIDFGRAFAILEDGLVLDMLQDQVPYILPETYDDSFDLAYYCFEFVRSCIVDKKKHLVNNEFVGLCIYISGISSTTADTISSYKLYAQNTGKKVDYRVLFTRSIKIRPQSYKLRSTPDQVLDLIKFIHSNGISLEIRQQIQTDVLYLQNMQISW